MLQPSQAPLVLLYCSTHQLLQPNTRPGTPAEAVQGEGQRGLALARQRGAKASRPAAAPCTVSPRAASAQCTLRSCLSSPLQPPVQCRGRAAGHSPACRPSPRRHSRVGWCPSAPQPTADRCSRRTPLLSLNGRRKALA